MATFSAYMDDVVTREPALSIEALYGLLEIPDEAMITLPSGTNESSRFGDDLWRWPEYLMPHKTPSQRCINFKIPSDLRSIGGEGLLKTIKRLLVLSISAPLHGSIRLPGLQIRQRILCEFGGLMISEGRYSFASLTEGDWVSMLEKSGRGRVRHEQKLISHLNVLRDYGLKGLIEDYPGKMISEFDFDQFSVEMDSGDDFATQVDEEKDSITYLPLSDEYVAEMGRRCIFYLNEIGPNLVRIFSNHPDMDINKKAWMPRGRNGGTPTKGTLKIARTAAWKEYLNKFEWVGSDGAIIKIIPFKCDNLIFPPLSLAQLDRLVSRHVDSILHILLLLSGGRQSEVQLMERGVVLREGESGAELGVVTGRTPKPSGSGKGDIRNWPVPLQVAGWLRNQAHLADALAPPGNNGLWWSMSTTHLNVARIDPHYRCANFAVRHGLAHLNEGRAHPHRYRKSIARLALLSLTGAPAIVMKMFGHSDIMTTLNYLFADPLILDDMREMLGERRAEVALTVLEDLDRSAGAAANTVRSARDQFFDELEVPNNERSQRVRMLQFITAKMLEGNIDIKILYPGILCIRTLEQSGLCISAGGQINPSKCQSRCRYRLELSLRIDEINDIIEDLFDDLSSAEICGNDVVKPFLIGQIIDHVEIFDEIKDKYKNDPRYKKIEVSRP
ncbi:site-specific integrase [Sphingobium yanoikuyae]|uniref:Site-specific integrase n=1 Tax=Sphingobium yanoikuyae TaxID=13690 RepID=A0A9X7YE19_SPHYA|nr:site-specific integrase [Sphingobium yanoikuyae]QNG47079.1 site-specific integrase [Sphingobium yanoikuyae]